MINRTLDEIEGRYSGDEIVKTGFGYDLLTRDIRGGVFTAETKDRAGGRIVATRFSDGRRLDISYFGPLDSQGVGTFERFRVHGESFGDSVTGEYSVGDDCELDSEFYEGRFGAPKNIRTSRDCVLKAVRGIGGDCILTEAILRQASRNKFMARPRFKPAKPGRGTVLFDFYDGAVRQTREKKPAIKAQVGTVSFSF